ncbi:hypothetical protein ABEB36_014604 [Hypothenemus hampei]|uniref:THAP-type domain-containing protein n=1 Tax=Hypothenemus hampei TaxID=57062 RepID=A0ABD1E2A3_HYPHA
MSCSVKDCKSAKKFNEKGVRFHRFPQGDLLAHWKTTLNLDKNWTRTAQKFVCSKHFKVEDYLVIGKTTRLRPNAVPSVSICQSQLFPRKEDVLNTFATLIEFKDPKGDIVSWRFIEKLHKLQDEETIRLANKLKKTHLEDHREIHQTYDENNGKPSSKRNIIHKLFRINHCAATLCLVRPCAKILIV